ncbi:hypothetical protein [Prochlorococcus marinus]|uniref:hypothetical protein n=1 Tax=Prochlorococcus marinus TaxID=1219 RepID=UPI0022B567DA|nr:hypothetical protein [Prochlorococcus marinus]
MNPPGWEEEMERYKLSVLTKLKLLKASYVREIDNNKIVTTSTLAKCMVKVGTTSKIDVTQKEKKP